VLSLVGLLGANAPAQVPDGWYAVSFFGLGTEPPTNGVFLFHPRTPGPAVRITGLDPDLTGDLGPWARVRPVASIGGSSLLVRPSDGALVVGERTPQMGDTIDLHIVQLSGTHAVSTVKVPLGISGGGGEVTQADFLPNEDVLVGVSVITSGPLANQLLGIVSRDGSTVTAVPVTLVNPPAGNIINATAASRDGTEAYLGLYVSGVQGEVLAVPLPQGGTARHIATIPAGISNLAVEPSGRLIATGLGGPPNLFAVDPANGNVVAIPTSVGTFNAVAVETVTSNFAIVTANAGSPRRSVFWMEPSGDAHLLCDPVFQTPSGIDVRHDPRVYGAGSPRDNAYDWALTPNPGGLPTLGNAGFSVTLTSAPGTAPGAVVVSLAAASFPLLGVQVLVDPARVLQVLPIAGSPSLTIPYPVPDEPALSGTRLHFQSFHQEPGGLAASPGLLVGVL
jgi:hypothetical protein